MNTISTESGTKTERTIYLIGLVSVLFILLAVVGLPSLAGVVVLTFILVLGWRLGVIMDPHPFRSSVEEEVTIPSP